MVTFDSTNEPLNDWGSASMEREVEIGVHWFDVSKVLFDSPWLNTPCQAWYPTHDCGLWGWEQRPVVVVEVVVFSVPDERLLANVVGGSGTGCEAMPKIECDRWRVLRVALIPPMW
jgi:hypothetical protein